MHCLSRPMPEAHPMIGQPIRRKEDPHFLRGGGRYVHDLTSPGLLHLAFVRSPYAHAAVHAIDATRARRLPGVVAVLAAADLPLSPIEPEFAGDEYHGAGWPPLAGERVRFVGDPVAVVAASDRYLAEDAVELLEVTYDPLPVVASVEDARRPDAVLVHDTVPGNVYFRRDHVHGDVDGIFATAALVVGGTFRHQRLAGAPLEGRGIVAQWDSTGRLTVWASTQVPHLMRTGLARFLGVPEAAVRVIAPDVGGGFGPKMHLYPEDLVACAVARRLGRPAKWIEDRRENLLAMTQAREQVIEAQVAVDRDGRLLALRAHIACDSGAGRVPLGRTPAGAGAAAGGRTDRWRRPLCLRRIHGDGLRDVPAARHARSPRLRQRGGQGRRFRRRSRVCLHSFAGTGTRNGLRPVGGRDTRPLP